MLLLKLKKLVALICILSIACGCMPVHTFAVSGDATAFINILCEEMLTNEISNAITTNLNLDLSGILPNGVSVSFESNSSALVVDGEAAHVVRSLYHDTPVTLTATVTSESESVKKELNFTVLKESKNVHLSENFYYPNNKGKLLTDEASLNGWNFLHTTLLSGESDNAKRFKAITEEVNGDYVLKGYRETANNGDYNYLQYSFGNKPSGDVSVKADITFRHTPGNQVYVFRAHADYNAGGTIENARIFEVNFKYNADGKSSIYAPYFDGDEQKTIELPIDNMPEAGKEAEIEWKIDTDAQVWYLYIDGNKVNTDGVPFYEKDKTGALRTNVIDITAIDFNTYRGYAGGSVYIDDLLVTSEYKYDASRFNVTEEMLTNQPKDVITENLDVSLENELPEGISVSFESNSDAININTGAVTRDTYRDIPVKLTATVTDGSSTWKNNLYFTVLRQSTKVYMAENFYYPSGKNKVLYDVPGIKRVEVNAEPILEGNYGWSSRYSTEMSEETTSGMRFKSYIDTEENKYILHSYRPIASQNEQNSTYYVLGEKPKGEVIQKARVKFEHTTTPQIYVFRTYGIYMVDGVKKRVVINETNFSYKEESFNIYMPCHNGQGMETLYYYPENIPTGEWADVEWRYHSDSLMLDFYINGVLINSSPIPFSDALNTEVDRSQYIGMNDFEFNSYRGYGKGHFYIDDISVISNPEWYDENQEIFYVYNNLAETDFTDEDKNAITQNLDFENNTMADYISANGITVTYSSNNTSFISNSGEVTRGKMDTPVTVTAIISKNGESIKKELNFTVLCKEEYEKIASVAKRFTPEIFTDESVKHISKSFDLDYSVLSDVDFSDIEVSFKSSNSDVLYVDSQSGKCVVRKTDKDTDVSLTAVITQKGTNLTVTKELPYRVVSDEKNVYYSDSFFYPDKVGSTLTSVRSDWWSTNYGADVYYTNEIAVANNNHYVHTERTQPSGSQRYLSYTYPTASQYKVAYEVDVKFNHTDTPQYYFFAMEGSYLLPDGTVEKDRIVDLNFYDEGYRSYLFARSEDEKEVVRSVYLLETIPKDKWMTLRVEINTAEQTADFYIDGIKLNKDPVGLYKCTSRRDQDLFHVENLKITAFRTQAGEIDLDNFAAYTVKGDVSVNNIFYSGGEKIIAIEEAQNGKIDLEARLYNQTDKTTAVSVALCEFQGRELKNIQIKNITLDTNPATIEKIVFKDFVLSDNRENSKVKVYLLDNKNINPYSDTSYFENILNREVTSGQMTCNLSGRTYNWVDFNGENMIRNYFTMQGWSPDGTKFYVRDDDFRIYEYDIETSKVKYLDTGKYEHTMTVTPLGGMFYVNKYNEIIRMDVDTYEKKIVGKVPSEYADKVSMLQVMDTEEKLSIEWTDKQLAEGSRFPVLDIATGEWDLSHSYVFDTEWYAPNHVSINPVKPNLLMFCHEGTAVNDRLWVLDMDTDNYYNVFVPKFYTSNSAGEIACHEMWTHDGENIVFQKSGGSSTIGYTGVVSIKYDGTERNYINDDYSYCHVATSPVSNRWIVGDTAYSNGKTSEIILIDAYTGQSHVVAQVSQTGINPGHCHPAFNQDGTKVWFGHYDPSGKIIRIGWADVSDIINNAPKGDWYNLSDSCDSFSYKGTESEVEILNHDGQLLYSLPAGNIMRVNVKSETAYQESGDIEVKITYLDEGTDSFHFTYYTFDTSGSYNRLVKNTKQITRSGTGQLKTVILNLNGVCLDNMERLKTDFTISGNSAVKITSVEMRLK